tara:strand:+ start:699 stop:908 length:210 start_codon:yes stop_codon:yes gene_type:complete
MANKILNSPLFVDFGKRIIYGLGFGSGMGIPYYLSRKLPNDETRVIYETDQCSIQKKPTKMVVTLFFND